MNRPSGQVHGASGARNKSRLTFDDSVGDRQLFFNARLFPYRSMSKRSANIMIGIIAVACTLAGLRFIIAGAWPVVVFVGVDVAAIWLAFHLSFRSAKLFETIQLSEKDLILTRVHPNGQTESWRFEPYWAKAWIETIEGQEMLFISSNSDPVPFGSFLAEQEKSEFLQTFNHSLQDWKRQDFK
jgi:uncharacterized membrane protein